LRALLAHTAAAICIEEGDKAAEKACRGLVYGITHQPADLEAARDV
jgi:hypothetical protein